MTIDLRTDRAPYRQPYRAGLLVAVEGLDCSGKTTLVRALRDRGVATRASREPYTTHVKALASEGRATLRDYAEDRDHHRRLIQSWCNRADVVVATDRHWLSTCVHQRGADERELVSWCRARWGEPDLWVICPTPDEAVLRERHEARGEVFDDHVSNVEHERLRTATRCLRAPIVWATRGSVDTRVAIVHGAIQVLRSQR